MLGSPLPHAVRPGACTALLLLLACGGGGDGGGGTAPPAVASVVITAPGTPPTFQTLTRTAQFTAVARDASSAPVAGVTPTWLSSNTSVATVSAGGLVTAVGNGTTQVTASASGITSTPVTVTVAQVAAALTVSPAQVAFGALGSTRQLVATLVDSSGAAVAGAPTITWSRAGDGATANVSVTGLATALAVGATDTAVATGSGRTNRIPIAVTQVAASVLVSPAGTDTLRTTGRAKQFTGVARDSLANTIPGAAITWASSVPAVATVGSGTGLATAVADGSTNIVATSGAASGQRTLVVRRFASVFSFTPTSATISTPLGTQQFQGQAEDSATTALPIGWTSRASSIFTVAPASGATTTATAAGNGTAYLVWQAGTRTDSALVTVSGQASAPLTATVLVGNFFFQSQRNGSQNQAVDTVGVGGTVTWQWQAGTHTVQSLASPSFASSGNISTGTYVITFNNAGTYQYDCAIHSNMTGRIVVR